MDTLRLMLTWSTTYLRRIGVALTIYTNGNPVPGLGIRCILPIPWRRDYEVGSSRHKVAFDALLGPKTLSLLACKRFDILDIITI